MTASVSELQASIDRMGSGKVNSAKSGKMRPTSTYSSGACHRQRSQHVMVSENVRKGVALNSVHSAELLVEESLVHAAWE